MATNLISLVMQFLTPDLIGRIATALGLDRDKVQTAVSSAVPGLLAALNNVAAQPGGAQRLADAARQQTGSLGNFASMLAGGGQSSFQASQVLSSLLGNQNQNALTEAIAKFTGLGQGATSSLLGMLAPIVMGIIGKHQGAAGDLDAKGIANLFASQKDNIAAVLPSDLGSLLSGTGILNSLRSAARTTTAASDEAIREASATRLVDAARQRGGAAPTSSNWLYWLLPLGAAAALLIYLAARPTEQVSAGAVESNYTATSTATPEAVWKKVGDFCGIATWHPAIEKCVLSDDGKMRTLSLKGGGTIVETLVSRDENAHLYTYKIVSSPLPVSDYVSTIKVLPEGSGSLIVWTGNYKAKGASDADAKTTIDGIYKAGVDAIAK
jgi:hypothetical protein